MTGLLFVTLLLLFVVNIEITQKIEVDILKNQLIQKLGQYIQITENDEGKSIKLQMIKYAFILFVGIVTLVYSTTQNILITISVSSLYLITLPYLFFLRNKQAHKQTLLVSVFIYTQSLLILLREDRTVVDILRECEDSMNEPLKLDLIEINNYIAKTTDIQSALTILEEKYHYSIVINAHILLRHKAMYGHLEQGLIDYLYANIENYELAYNEFIAKRKTNTTLFYIIIGLNAFGVYSLTNFISMQSSAKNGFMLFILFSYYVLNLVTVILYEQWCYKTLVLE